jgi:hypothetical protein
LYFPRSQLFPRLVLSSSSELTGSPQVAQPFDHPRSFPVWPYMGQIGDLTFDMALRGEKGIE